MSAKLAGKLPPQNIDAEQSVLGAVLIDREAIMKVADLVLPDDFYEENHRLIFAAMADLFRQHKPIDLLTLSSILEDRGLLDRVGGDSYRAELTNLVPTAAHVLEYARIVKEKATLRGLISAGSKITELGFGEDRQITDTLDTAEKELFKVSQAHIKENFVHIRKILDEAYERIHELHESDDKNHLRGVPTGFYNLDKMLSGLQPSDLVIVAARPSMGKTSFALNIAQNVAVQQKKSVGIFSFEMSKEQLVERLLSSLLMVDNWKLRTGQLSEEEMDNMGEAMGLLSEANIFIDDQPDSHLIDIRSKARRLQMEHGLDLIIVDYLQLMGGTNPYNRVSEISEISRNLKILARELNVPLIAVSQLSRAVETRVGSKVPQLSDLRESGSIEQDADVVLMLYREDYYDPETERAGVTEVHIKKHRNGPTGMVELMFNKQQMRFYSIDSHREPESDEVMEIEGEGAVVAAA